jgi:hypothetical protein
MNHSGQLGESSQAESDPENGHINKFENFSFHEGINPI